MNDLFPYLSIVLINLIGVISPGPGFILVLKNSLNYGKLSGFLTGLGIALGDLTHMLYCFAGIGILIKTNDNIFFILKFIGAFYLIYIGIKSVFSKSITKISSKKINKKYKINSITEGYLTTIVNPKATLMFLGIFSTIFTPEIPLKYGIFIIIGMFLNPLIWFLIVSIFFNNKKIRNLFLKNENFMNKLFGIFLLIFGILVLIK